MCSLRRCVRSSSGKLRLSKRTQRDHSRWDRRDVGAPEDEDRLAETMSQLMRDPGKRLRLAKNAQSVLDRFGMETIGSRWKEILQ